MHDRHHLGRGTLAEIQRPSAQHICQHGEICLRAISASADASQLIGAVNAATGETNVAYDVDGSSMGIPQLAGKWKDEGREWLVIAENNYGEGSAREHAALQPRYLGGRVILAKSFARIHETNLKKQGIVPLVFENEADYDKIDACDEVTTEGLYDVLTSGGKGAVRLRVKKHGSGEEVVIPVRHALSEDQCRFILAGSALNLLAKKGRIGAV